MSKRKVTSTVAVITIMLCVGLFSNQHVRWLLFYGIPATSLSKQFLDNDVAETPEWALDFVIVAGKENKVVTFSEHHSWFTYAYSQEMPDIAGYEWSHLVGKWYVGKVKT
ncbi:hypothetical protein [Neptuniibacter sp. QD37_11]|uniref:hypothetical protein n=1 Tax=Neptuniibacter sp. QD37_11 TaxID=3398209 RepID=UPI0039F4F355